MDRITVNPENIDKDCFFKISKRGPSQRLVESVSKCGIAEMPVLIKMDQSLRILFGHNRLAAAEAAGIKNIVCSVTDCFDSDLFLATAAAKNYRGELGPAGKLKAVFLLQNNVSCAKADSFLKAKSLLEIPPDFTSEFIESILSLDSALLAFCDDKGVPVRTMTSLIHLSDSARMLLCRWIGSFPVKMNLFRTAAELCFEIERAGANERYADLLMRKDVPSEDELPGVLMDIKNPVLHDLQIRAQSLIGEYRSKGIDLSFPPFFEGDAVNFGLTMKRKDHGASFKRSLEYLGTADSAKILDIL
ncbi:MAG: hypothetical protein ACRCUT_09135 [Spirochaetota bacterium]